MDKFQKQQCLHKKFLDIKVHKFIQKIGRIEYIRTIKQLLIINVMKIVQLI